MNSRGIRFSMTVSGILVLAAVAGFVLIVNGAAAQSPDQGPRPKQWD